MLFEKIKKFVIESKGVKGGYQILISGMVVAIALDNEFMHAELGKLLVAENANFEVRNTSVSNFSIMTD